MKRSSKSEKYENYVDTIHAVCFNHEGDRKICAIVIEYAKRMYIRGQLVSNSQFSVPDGDQVLMSHTHVFWYAARAGLLTVLDIMDVAAGIWKRLQEIPPLREIYLSGPPVDVVSWRRSNGSNIMIVEMPGKLVFYNFEKKHENYPRRLKAMFGLRKDLIEKFSDMVMTGDYLILYASHSCCSCTLSVIDVESLNDCRLPRPKTFSYRGRNLWPLSGIKTNHICLVSEDKVVFFFLSRVSKQLDQQRKTLDDLSISYFIPWRPNDELPDMSVYAVTDFYEDYLYLLSIGTNDVFVLSLLEQREVGTWDRQCSIDNVDLQRVFPTFLPDGRMVILSLSVAEQYRRVLDVSLYE